MDSDFMDSILYKIVPNFSIGGLYTHGYSYGTGEVNKTYCVFFQNSTYDRYLIQKINTTVFGDPSNIMENIYSITTHLQYIAKEEGTDPINKTLNIIPTIGGNLYYTDQKGGCWRAMNFIENTCTYQKAENNGQVYSFGEALGSFHADLADFSPEDLYETEPNLHNTGHWLERFKETVKLNPSKRVKKSKKEIDFLLSRESDANIITDLIEKGDLLRASHNNAKINNVLFDKDTEKAVCMIDFDTLMPGSYLFDFGEAVRTTASTSDENDSAKTSLDMNVFEEFTKGYLKKASSVLSKDEIRLLPFSVKLMAYETAIKYLSDFLNGDRRYKTNSVNQNLERTRNQIKLIEDIESQLSHMGQIIKKYL